MIEPKISRHILFGGKKKVMMDVNYQPTVKCETGFCKERVALKKSENKYFYVGQCPNCSCLYSTPIDNVE